MPILSILFVLVAIGVIMWLINAYVPMPRFWKNLINAVVAIMVIIWLLQVFGVLSSLKSVHT